MMNLDSVIGTFIAESQELLQQMEDALLQIEQQPKDPELINAIFRAAHTIKGSAGLFGFDSIVVFTHVAESVLDRVRGSELLFDEELVALMLKAGDHLSVMVGQLAEGGDLADLPAAVHANGESLIQALSCYLDQQPTAATGLTESAAKDTSAIPGHWHLSLRFGPDTLRNGMDPFALIRYLTSLGKVLHIETVTDYLPALDAMDPEACYLGFEIAFASEAEQGAIEGAFEFVRDDASIRILPPGATTADFQALLAERANEAPYQLERLIRCSGMDATILSSDETAPPAVEANATAEQAATASEQRGAREASRGGDASLIRVDASKLDQLINLIGELIIAGANTRMLAQSSGLVDMCESAETLARLVEEVRDSALTLRMVQIGATFNRFQRVVRDVSKELGKDIVLLVSGGDTELDKTVVERIGDPLTHLVRNAMDHGIEPAGVRRAIGKPLQGVVRLNAYHEAGGIVIEVSDDGGGLDPQKILAKAQQRGLVSEEQQLSDKEIFNLIFEPGFSTAEKISNLSGRGVGMDVVKRNITALRGTVELDSQLAQGTCVRIRLPLTLAIIDGFLIGVGQASYVLPLDMVEECIELPSEQIAGQEHLDLRGDVLPFIRLRQLFDERSQPPRRENVVVVSYAGIRAGLVVDQLLGEFQTVIKPLGAVFCQVPGLSGFTILGSGAVALILNIPGLLAQFTEAGRPRAAAAAPRSSLQ